MGREYDGYRDNLASILEFTGGAHTLNITDVCRYTGISKRETVRRHYNFSRGRITAEALARALAGGQA